MLDEKVVKIAKERIELEIDEQNASLYKEIERIKEETIEVFCVQV